MMRRDPLPGARAAARSRRRRSLLVVLLSALIAITVVVAVKPLRESALLAVGNALVEEDAPRPVDVVVVSRYAGLAGVIEAADLVAAGYARRAAVFDVPPLPAELELSRRGIDEEDATSRYVRLLGRLGVPFVDRIPDSHAGTQNEAAALMPWMRKSRFGAAILVTSMDHSRRTRRVLARSVQDGEARVLVRGARSSDFDAQRWWHSRDGVRIVIVEAQKLVLDVATHPLDF